jgi:glutamine synthetase
MSPLFRSYVAGQMHCMPDLLPLYAPTVNSYKRLVEGAWAPTRVNWGVDNRTCALRAIPGSAKSTRLETRVNGSDANPYLAIAAALASGLYGIERGLELEATPVAGSGYQDERAPTLPRNLHEATMRMAGSPLARELLGDAFVEHFVATRLWEWRQFSKAVTSWEMARYFEVI